MSISIGVVGAGQFAPSFLRLWSAHPDVHQVSLTDVLPDRLVAMAEQQGVAITYQSFEEMLDSDVDAIAIFTQRWLHGEMAIRALEAGKHVYSTVPMAIEADQIARIIELVKQTGLTYMMGETSFYYPSSVYCRDKLA
jgi:predicted dehydrogenase